MRAPHDQKNGLASVLEVESRAGVVTHHKLDNTGTKNPRIAICKRCNDISMATIAVRKPNNLAA